MASSASRAYDVVVLGASGFTGQWILSALAALPRGGAHAHGLRIAAAGRRRDRLEAAIARTRREVPSFTTPIDVVIADVGDPASLLAMASASRLVVNAVGPFRFFGEPVVTACIAGRADYLDISGEPEFLETMELRHDAAAREAGVLSVSSCGFDSIPADMGVIFGTDTLRAQRITPSSVESFLTLASGPLGAAGHFATFESAVHGFGSADELRGTRKRYAALHPAAAVVPIVGRRLPRREGKFGPLFWARECGAWAIPFLGADASIVKRTQRIGVAEGVLALPDSGAAAAATSSSSSAPAVPIQFAAYSTFSSGWGAALFLLFGTVFQALARYGWGRSLLLRFPGAWCGVAVSWK